MNGYLVDFGAVVPWLPVIGRGIGTTVWLCALSMTFTMIVALPLALVRMSRQAALNTTANIVISVTRSVPLYIFLLWLFYGVPLFFPMDLSPVAAGLVTLVVQFTSFQAEAYRSGLMAVTRGQKEAAAAVGLTSLQTFRYVTAPQALRVAIPPTINTLIAVFKSTSVLAVIGVVEVTRIVTGDVAATGRPLEFYTVLTVIYIAGVGLLSLVGVAYERATNVQRLAAAGEKKRLRMQLAAAQAASSPSGAAAQGR